MLTIRRSPAKVCWWVMLNGQIVETRRTKADAQKFIDENKHFLGE